MIKNFRAEQWWKTTHQESRAEARDSLEKVAEIEHGFAVDR
jgi:hypothetical protein